MFSQQLLLTQLFLDNQQPNLRLKMTTSISARLKPDQQQVTYQIFVRLMSDLQQRKTGFAGANNHGGRIKLSIERNPEVL
jgi:hypothetical protein